MNLYKKLISYSESDYYGFHMPGHKRNKDATVCRLPYELDITEIEGFDDLHHARGILKEAQERAARLYGADETYFLVNGSTVGILSAILGSTCRGEQILVARNCHKSVYHAIYMNGLQPLYVYPQYISEIQMNGPISVKDVKQCLQEHPDIRAVVITSPTYDGVISDIKGIAEVVHEVGIPLIVDEAHGAHFGFHPYFMENSNRLGADIVIHSLHKTLPVLTQTALLHVNGEIADRRCVQQYLHMLQTSSPSYVLMASIDACLQRMEEEGQKYFSHYVYMLNKTRQELKLLKYLKLVETECYDRSKLVISVQNDLENHTIGNPMSSAVLYHTLLQKYHLQMEMRAGFYVLAMTSVADTEQGMGRLVSALKEIDDKLVMEASEDLLKKISDERISESGYFLPDVPEQKYTSSQVEDMRRNVETSGLGTHMICSIPWGKCRGYVSAEYAYVYPPGIPLIVPGEVIGEELCRIFEAYTDMGFSIEGLQKEGEIEVLIDG